MIQSERTNYFETAPLLAQSELKGQYRPNTSDKEGQKINNDITLEESFLQRSHTVNFYVMDKFFEGPCATCYGSSVKTQIMRKAGKLHLLVQHSPLIL